ncbi:hypothetical protein [Bacteroides pyogenes]|uniref:hypothetical protein n=1 Tax=Bacteroides pyogenes TaxID=310300 RepID=UPI00155A04B2|nr:hypothetical protein [Bacteroides pyogenes]
MKRRHLGVNYIFGGYVSTIVLWEDGTRGIPAFVVFFLCIDDCSLGGWFLRRNFFESLSGDFAIGRYG